MIACSEEWRMRQGTVKKAAMTCEDLVDAMWEIAR